MRYVSIAVLACALAVIGFAQQNQENPQQGSAAQTTMNGYLVDAMCGKKMALKDKPMEKAAAHTKDCAMNDACAASGFGVLSDGKYYKFDTDGSAKAKQVLEQSSREDNLYVQVTGTVQDSTMTVATISEATPPSQ